MTKIPLALSSRNERLLVRLEVHSSLDAPTNFKSIAAAFDRRWADWFLGEVQSLQEKLEALKQAEEVDQGLWGR